MSETHDISEVETRNMPAMPSDPETTPFPVGFEPLVDDETDDFGFSQTPLTPRPPRKRRRWLIALIIVLVVMLVGGGIITYASVRSTPTVTYNQATVTVGNLVATVSGTGPVQAGATYNLNFTASATIKTIDVHVGQVVKKGDVLATIDPTALQDAVTTAQNNVDSAQTNLNSAQTNLATVEEQQSTSLEIAAINEQNALKACTTSSGSSSNQNPNATPTPTPTPDPTTVANCQKLARAQYAQSVNQANSAINNAKNQVTSAQQQLTTAQNALATAKTNLNGSKLIAPADGTISAINGQVGSTAGSGSSGSGGNGSSSSALMVLIDDSSMTITASINEANIASVAEDQAATFTVTAYPSQTFRATVTGVDIQGSTSSSVVTYPVYLSVDMDSVGTAHLYPGMTATVDITTQERIGVLLVPAAALTFSTTAIQNGELSRSSISALNRGNTPTSTGTPTDGGTSGNGDTTTGTRGIVVELKDGKLVPVLITTGLTNGTYTEVLSGLKEGDSIVISQTGGTTTSSSSSGTRNNNGGGNFTNPGGGGNGGGRGGFGGPGN